MNLLQNRIKCIECGNTNLIKDIEKQEIYCSKCGLVVLDTSIPTIEHLQYIIENSEDESKNKKTRKIQHQRWNKFLYGFKEVIKYG